MKKIITLKIYKNFIKMENNIMKKKLNKFNMKLHNYNNVRIKLFKILKHSFNTINYILKELLLF